MGILSEDEQVLVTNIYTAGESPTPEGELENIRKHYIDNLSELLRSAEAQNEYATNEAQRASAHLSEVRKAASEVGLLSESDLKF